MLRLRFVSNPEECWGLDDARQLNSKPDDLYFYLTPKEVNFRSKLVLCVLLTLTIYIFMYVFDVITITKWK